jgi:hypothetical protein
MKKITLSIIFILILSTTTKAQDVDSTQPKSALNEYNEQFEVITLESFRIKTGMFLGSSSPQKYGADAELFFGKFTEEIIYPGRYYSYYRGFKASAGIYRGGYRYSLGYFDNTSFISRAGYGLSVAYLVNNSFARFRESTELIGIQGELNLMFQVRFGVYREIDGGKLVPMLGIGLPIGPNMYEN